MSLRPYFNKNLRSQRLHDFFMLFTAAETSNFTLPRIVDPGNWVDYFGPWANRLFIFHQVIVGDDCLFRAARTSRKCKALITTMKMLWTTENQVRNVISLNDISCSPSLCTRWMDHAGAINASWGRRDEALNRMGSGCRFGQ